MGFNTRPTREESSKRLEKLQAKKEEMERVYPICREWWQFDVLSQEEKNRRYAVWTQYYNSLKGGKYHKMFVVQVELLKTLKTVKQSSEDEAETIAMLKKNARIARQMLADGIPDEPNKPRFRDPAEFYYSDAIQNYKVLLEAIEKLSPTTAISENVSRYLA